MYSLVYLYLIIGLLLISYGASLLVSSTENIANKFNASKEDLVDVIKSLNRMKSLIIKISKIQSNDDSKIYLNDTKKSLLDNLAIIINNKNNYSSNNNRTGLPFLTKKPSPPPKEGCYIATMAYGDYDHPQVLELRKFRDEILERSLIGRLLINIYYRFSPRLVIYFQYKHKINIMIKKILDNFINYYLK